MPIAILIVLVAGALAVAVLYRELRVIAIAALVIFAGAVAAYMLIGGTTTEDRRARIGREELILAGVELVEGPRYETLTGRVTNGSQVYRLRDFEVTVRLHDCPSIEAPLSDCQTISEATGIARVSVPPGQTRAFRTVLGFADAPPPIGVLRWEQSVGAITATD